MGNCLASNNNKTNNTLDKVEQPKPVQAQIPFVPVQPKESNKEMKGSMAVSIGLTGSSMAKQINNGLEQPNQVEQNPVIAETSSLILGQEQKEPSQNDSIGAIKIKPNNSQTHKPQPQSPQQVQYSEAQKKDLDDILAEADLQARVDDPPRERPTIQQSAVIIHLDVKQVVNQAEEDPLGIIDIP